MLFSLVPLQMILASCSGYVRDLILAAQGGSGCECNTVTVFLPDFNAATVRNLLNILYTGASLCSFIFNPRAPPLPLSFVCVRTSMYLHC